MVESRHAPSTVVGLPIDKRQRLGRREYLQRYYDTRTPVVVTDALDAMPARTRWTLGYFRDLFGDSTVALQGDGFQVMRESRVADFIDSMAGYREPFAHDPTIPYLKSSYQDFNPFALATYARLKADWGPLYFLPRRGYLRPRSLVRTLDPTVTMPDAFGVLISPVGGQSRLHEDGERTVAVLYQFQGRKRAYLFPQASRRDLLAWFASRPARRVRGEPPSFGGVVPHVAELGPGDVLVIPDCWFHEVYTLESSITLTYNFALVRDYLARQLWVRRGGPDRYREFIAAARTAYQDIYPLPATA